MGFDGILSAMDNLETWRREFPILSRCVYMINNSLGAMPRQTAQNLAAYADAWATRGVRAWEDRWWEMAAEVGDRIARVIGAARGTVSMHENVTTAHLVALSCLRPSAGRRTIVCTAMDFPSMVYLFRAQRANGFELRVVPGERDLTVPTERLLDAIDDTTAVVACSHVLFRTSYIMDAADIVARAHERGAVVILDTYQSAGIIPVDVDRLGVDFAVGGCLKWLCGGPGNAFLYTRSDAIDDTTAVVACSHVLFRTSYIMDAADIVARAHERGAVVILDTYQSAGIIPVDVDRLGVDFAVGGCLKWLCGGPGNAFLYT